MAESQNSNAFQFLNLTEATKMQRGEVDSYKGGLQIQERSVEALRNLPGPSREATPQPTWEIPQPGQSSSSFCSQTLDPSKGCRRKIRTPRCIKKKNRASPRKASSNIFPINQQLGAQGGALENLRFPSINFPQSSTSESCLQAFRNFHISEISRANSSAPPTWLNHGLGNRSESQNPHIGRRLPREANHYSYDNQVFTTDPFKSSKKPETSIYRVPSKSRQRPSDVVKPRRTDLRLQFRGAPFYGTMAASDNARERDSMARGNRPELDSDDEMSPDDSQVYSAKRRQEYESNEDEPEGAVALMTEENKMADQVKMTNNVSPAEGRSLNFSSAATASSSSSSSSSPPLLAPNFLGSILQNSASALPPRLPSASAMGGIPLEGCGTLTNPDLIVRAVAAARGSRKPRGQKKPIPNCLKDKRYYERRMRNNAAAKKSRDNRKRREDETAKRAAVLQTENLILQKELTVMKAKYNVLMADTLKKGIESGCMNQSVLNLIYGLNMKES